MISANLSRNPGTPFQPAAGQEVHVRPASEILSSLDEQGTLGGLPFMPEMLPYCGRKFRIQRVANKACINADSVYIGSLPRCFVLEIPDRCNGSGHGGCQMACKFLWRPEWLSPDPVAVDSHKEDQQREFESFLTKLGSPAQGRFRCQATELVQIATPTSAFEPKQYVNDIRSGVPVPQVARFLGGLALRKLLRKSDRLVGACGKRTPRTDLGLKVGDKVRVRSLEQIQQTLDAQGCNRGLWFDPGEMAGYCEQELVVSRVLERLIDEKTGQLRELATPCVVLSETECSGVSRRFCSRGMLHFWREIWLERV